jgi:acyl-coenzyme A synthetase/AMP-(fatty) acid ligase
MTHFLVNLAAVLPGGPVVQRVGVLGMAPASPRSASPPGSLEQRADAHPDEPCLIDDARARTRGEWDRRACALAEGLAREAGVGPGDRVAWQLANRVELFELTFALAKLGAVAVGPGPRLAGEALVAAARVAGARALVGTGAGELRVLRLDGDGSWDYEALVGAHADAPRRLVGSVAATASVTFTAGTTGPPRPVLRAVTPAAVAGAAVVVADLVRRLALGSHDRHLLVLPAAGWAPSLLAQLTLALGGHVVATATDDPARWLALVEEHAITTTVLGPAQLAALVALPPEVAEPVDTTSLDRVVSTGAPLTADLAARATDLLGEGVLADLYGSAEAGPVALDGRPLAGVALATTASGELEVRSPLAAEEPTRPGDRARLAPDGELTLLGRAPLGR